MFHKNDTKRKNFFHPYNTRSSSHDKNHPPQLKDTAFKDKPAAAAGVIVPPGLYNCVQVALASRKEWETKRDKPSMLKLKHDESKVKALANILKYTQHLPLTWKYNPVTANTLVPSDEQLPTLIRFDKEEEEGGFKDWRARSFVPGSLMRGPFKVRPNIYLVPMKEDETQSWLQFKKLDDEGNLTPVPGCKPYEIWFPVNIEHPFVSVIGSFAVNGFNEAFEMFVEKGKHNHLSDPAFRVCTFVKLGHYEFVMTIEAVEDGFCGIYEAKVKCTVDGKKTLLGFTLTGKKGVVGASASKSSKGKKVGGPSKSRSSKVVGLCLPASTGMMSRSVYNGVVTSGGYDYFNPSEMIL